MLTPKIHTAHQRLGFFMAALIAALVFNPGAVPKAAAQDKCAQEMAEAREKYNNGEFSAAIAIVGNCLSKSGLTPMEQKSAYELLALIHVANDDTVLAKRELQELWTVAPNYDPSSVEEAPALFIRLALATKPSAKPSEPSPKKGGSKKWLWIGGGTAVVAAGITAAVIVLRDGDEGFVKPPGRPEIVG